MERKQRIVMVSLVAASSVALSGSVLALVSLPTQQETAQARTVVAAPNSSPPLPDPSISLPPIPSVDVPGSAAAPQEDKSLSKPDVSVTQQLPTTSGKSSSGGGTQSSPRLISSQVAVNSVVAATSGSVVSVDSDNFNGYSCWAIVVDRSDGSRVVGYVDKQTGTVIGWATLRGADTGNGGNSGGGDSGGNDGRDDDDDYEYEDDDDDDDHEDDDDHDGDDHEDDDDHDGDDDDD